MSKIIMQLQKEFCKNFDSLTGRQDRRIVWEDFITISQHALDIHKHLEGEPLPTHIADFYHDEEWECFGKMAKSLRRIQYAVHWPERPSKASKSMFRKMAGPP